MAPVHLPVAIEQKKSSFSLFSGLMGWTTLALGVTLIVGGIVYKTVSLYQMARPRPVPCLSCSKIIFRPKLPERVVVEPEPLPENVVAVVGDEHITIEQVRSFVNEIPQLKEIPFEQVYPKMLELVINNKLVELGAAEMGIPEHPDIKKMIHVATEQIIIDNQFQHFWIHLFERNFL